MDGFNKIAILGLGLSGQAAFKALLERGINIIAWDDNAEKRGQVPKDYIAELSESTLKNCDVLLVSPGIPPTNPTVKQAQDLGVEVMCDIELWSRFYPQTKTIGITGTNGKSTVTALTTHIIKSASMPVHMGGNIGKPIFEIKPADDDWLVLELSSYQLEYCPNFRPDIAALLNITNDHLDRHGSMENYAKAKAKIFEGQGDAIIATDDAWTKQIAQMVQAAGLRHTVRVSGQGNPQDQNTSVVLAIVEQIGLSKDIIQPAITTYQPLKHRQNLVTEINGVVYINDSKATNVESAKAALSSYEDIIWIVGGQAKLGGLMGLEENISAVKHACVIGEKMKEVEHWLKTNAVAYSLCGTMEQAVIKAKDIAEQKSAKTILLSPACASFDQYDNFEQRGDDFELCVQKIL